MKRHIAILAMLMATTGLTVSPSSADEASRVKWQPSFSGSCENCNLFGRQMPFWDLTNAHYNGANVSHASLHGVQANGAYFDGIVAKFADFSRSQVNNAHFVDAQLQDARLVGIIANGADFSGATLDHSNANNATLVGANLTSISAISMNANGADFSAANASGAIFDTANLRGAIFNGALLTGARFIGSDLTGASFQDARLGGADLSRAINIQQADFSGACGNALSKLPEGMSLPACAE